MQFERITMDVLPPHLKKDYTFNTLNDLISQAFKETDIVKEVTKDNHWQDQTKVYLDSVRVETIKSVGMINRVGCEIHYVPYIETGSYANYIELNRPLETGEKLIIKYNIKPGTTEIFSHKDDTVYIRNDIYKTLLDIIYNKIKKPEKGVKEDGKN
jgi:hypothetical protein